MDIPGIPNLLEFYIDSFEKWEGGRAGGFNVTQNSLPGVSLHV